MFMNPSFVLTMNGIPIICLEFQNTAHILKLNTAANKPGTHRITDNHFIIVECYCSVLFHLDNFS